MLAAVIDTLKVSHKLQSVGMPRKQAEAVAEVMAETVADRSCKTPVVVAALRGDVIELKTTSSRIESLLGKILESQIVLHQNDMEQKRQRDQKQ
ncbi:MAG: hypothetical protein WCF85_22065 [Rhodospirillaceae bacterium]